MEVKLLNKKENIFGDGIANVEHWDFSKANLNEENRILAITQVASICYQNPKALGSESLYNRLMAESKGLPSSSFEMCPILLKSSDYHNIINNIYESADLGEDGNILIEQENNIKNFTLNIEKFGEWVEDSQYLLTNYRALVYDIENKYLDAKWYKHFNTLEECEIIAKHFKVFNYKVDLPTRSQMVRHRVNWQELSRRYVSGKKSELEFYISKKMKDIITYDMTGYGNNTEDVIDICVNHYYQALENGVKPEEARRILPQALYSNIWGAFQPSQLENFFKLRLDSHSQWEIRKVAEAMQELIEKENINGKN